jgi:hypothetical protein
MWLFCGIKASSIVPPIHCVDGEKRIYYSMHKYQVVEQAPISYFFKEIDKTLKNYQSLIESRNADRNVRGIIKQDWIKNKLRIRTHPKSNDAILQRLADHQARFREIDQIWKRLSLSPTPSN